jgi:hypothetical protein
MAGAAKALLAGRHGVAERGGTRADGRWAGSDEGMLQCVPAKTWSRGMHAAGVEDAMKIRPLPQHSRTLSSQIFFLAAYVDPPGWNEARVEAAAVSSNIAATAAIVCQQQLAVAADTAAKQ